MICESSAQLIELVDLTKRYGTVLAVDSLTLQIPRGGVYGLLGKNGSGKTTAIGMILGLVKPSGGSIRLFGVDDPSSLRQARARIGNAIEGPAFYPFLSGRDNLRLFQILRADEDVHEVQRLLDLVSISDAADRRFDTYSMGMRQRLAIARALLGRTDLAILDEPTNGLDPAGVAEVREVIRRLGSEGRTIILCSHQLTEVEQLCDSVAILECGRLVAQGSVPQLLHRNTRYALHTTNNVQARLVVDRLDWVTCVGDGVGALVVEVAMERAGELTRMLSLESVYVTELVPHRLTLEEYFLQVTGSASDALPRTA